MLEYISRYISWCLLQLIQVTWIKCLLDGTNHSVWSQSLKFSVFSWNSLFFVYDSKRRILWKKRRIQPRGRREKFSAFVKNSSSLILRFFIIDKKNGDFHWQNGEFHYSNSSFHRVNTWFRSNKHQVNVSWLTCWCNWLMLSISYAVSPVLY